MSSLGKFSNRPSGVVLARRQDVEKPQDASGLILEAWTEGYMIGSLIIMWAVTISNMKRGVILHKLIMIELLLGMLHGTFIFTNPPVYGPYLSTTAILLYMSWSLHNVIAWLKIKPFLSKRWSKFYIRTVILVQPYWVVESYANVCYFNNINTWFLTTRPLEALFRDPWWLFTTANLLYNITKKYQLDLLLVVKISPRFGVLIVSMILSIIFIILDIMAVTGVFSESLPDGLNPFWKLATVFKCLTDSILLDDFKSALDQLMRHKLQRDFPRLQPGAAQGAQHVEAVAAAEAGESGSQRKTSSYSNAVRNSRYDPDSPTESIQLQQPRGNTPLIVR